MKKFLALSLLLFCCLATAQTNIKANNITATGTITAAPGGQNHLIVDNSNDVQVFSSIIPIQPAPQLPSLFVGGNDLALKRISSADLWEAEFPAVTTTTASLAASANTNVLIGPVQWKNGVYGQIGANKTAVTGFNPGNHPLTGVGFTIYVGRETTNFEVLGYDGTANCPTPGTWNVVDSTHLCMNTTKTHTGTTDIEEIGDQYWATPIIHVYSNGTKPANGVLCPNAPLQIEDSNNTYIMFWPSALTDAHPCSAVRFNATITGENGATKSLLFRNNLTTSHFELLNSANSAIIFDLSENAAGGILKISNPTNTPLTFDTSGTDIARIKCGGTSSGCLVYGSNAGTGTNGVFAVRNNATDDTESFRVTTSTATTAVTNLAASKASLTETTAPSGTAASDVCYGDSTLHAVKCSYNNGTFFQIPQVITATSAAFATATTAGTCVQSTTAVTGATTAMVVNISPVSTPGIGAQWSAFVSSAGNVTINECAVAASAGGTIAFNIRVTP